MLNNKKDKKQKNKAVVIVGPTSSGKTSLAVSLALEYQGEIISADSRQVYKGMDIGTGKDLAEYKIETRNGIREIPHHLIDVCEPRDSFNLSQYLRLANEALDKVASSKKLPLIVGGTGLYVQALVDNYQISKVKENTSLRDRLEKENLSKVQDIFQQKYFNFFSKLNNSDKNNKRRLIRYLEILKDNGSLDRKTKHPNFEFLVLAIDVDREELRKRIKKRIVDRLDKEDMIGEVNSLHESGLSWNRLESFGLEYRYISQYLQSKISHNDMVENLHTATCRFAKRQRAWFRRWQKQGREIHFITSLKEAKEKIDDFINT